MSDASKFNPIVHLVKVFRRKPEDFSTPWCTIVMNPEPSKEAKPGLWRRYSLEFYRPQRLPEVLENGIIDVLTALMTTYSCLKVNKPMDALKRKELEALIEQAQARDIYEAFDAYVDLIDIQYDRLSDIPDTIKWIGGDGNGPRSSRPDKVKT